MNVIQAIHRSQPYYNRHVHEYHVRNNKVKLIISSIFITFKLK